MSDYTQTSINMTPAQIQQYAFLKERGYGDRTSVTRIAVDRMATQEGYTTMNERRELEPGHFVTIYHDPITMKDEEGRAKLVSEFRPDEGDGLSMWIVRFEDDPEERLRTVYIP